jgi:hypothetical protein
VGGDGDWRLLSFAFQGEFLPGGDAGPAVHLWRDKQQGKPLSIEHADVVERTTRWIDGMRDDKSFVRNV